VTNRVKAGQQQLRDPPLKKRIIMQQRERKGEENKRPASPAAEPPDPSLSAA
jgi:hypothetical protein